MSLNSSETYVSPLMNRIRDEEVLSLETLAKYVPAAQAALKAQEKLRENNNLTLQEKQDIRRIIAQGEYAKERLVLISMPLIKSLARKEHRRRQAWSSRITLEDIISEGLSGLMRGIRAYNPSGSHTSPTNYLGQWIVTDMRRNTETMEHDFAIPFEAMERQRKIRAIRSRLTSQLGREPLDDEIIAAASDSTYTNDAMMGKVDKTPSKQTTTPSRRRVLTQKHIEEEREMYTRTGAMRSSSVREDGEDYSITEETLARNVTDGEEAPYYATTGDPTEVDEREARNSMSSLLEDSFIVLRVGDIQQDVIRRRFALIPYEEEQTIKDIVLQTGVPKHKVNRILTAFSSEMTRANGPFHKLITHYDPEDLLAMGIGWALTSLGPFTPPQVTVQNKDLQEALIRRSSGSKTTARPQLSTGTTKGYQAYYTCEYDRITVSRHFLSESDANRYQTLTCPICQHKAFRDYQAH